MEANQSTNSAVPETSQSPSQAVNLKALLAQARGTKDMLLNFKAAIDDCTVHGSHIYNLALGVQFVNTLINQAKNDIDGIQMKIEEMHKAPVETVVTETANV